LSTSESASYFADTRRFSSVNQFTTTTMRAAVAGWADVSRFLIIRNRRPSRDTSYVRDGNGQVAVCTEGIGEAFMSSVGVPAVQVDPGAMETRITAPVGAR
jgi:hypothetical protein